MGTNLAMVQSYYLQMNVGYFVNLIPTSAFSPLNKF